MKKDIALIGGLFLAVILLLIFGQGFTSTGRVQPNTGRQSTTEASLGDQVNIKVRDLQVKAAVADSNEERKKGLSDREEIPLDWGLLFVFDEEKKQAIWMKNMKFAIDIIWIDKDKKIVDIAHSAAPEPGKKDNELRVYTPRSASKYVLEINAGIASLNNVQVGDTVEF